MTYRIFLATDSLGIGGSERQVLHLLQGLRTRRRFTVLLAVLDHGGELEPGAAASVDRVLPVRRRMRVDGSPALEIAWHAQRQHVDLIHAVGWMSGVACLAAARLTRLPIINGSLRAAPQLLKTRDRISRWCALRSDRIVSNSHGALSAYGLDAVPHAQVIPNGIDLERFEAVAGVPPPMPTVCMVANFSKWKDHATVLRAMSHVVRDVPDARLVLIGHDRGTLTETRALADQLGVIGRVRFVTDTLDPAPQIASSHVCVLSSPSESFPNAVLEYLALSKPVVATEICGAAAPLLRNGAGLLVPQDASTFSAAIVELLRNPARAQQMGETGRRAVERFGVEHMVSAYEELYELTIRAARASRGSYCHY